MMNWTFQGLWRNKANFRVDAKGQGLAGLPALPIGPVVQTNPICLTATGKGTGWQGRKCRSHRRQSCETKPIWTHPLLAYFRASERFVRVERVGSTPQAGANRPRPQRACEGDFSLWANSMRGGPDSLPGLLVGVTARLRGASSRSAAMLLAKSGKSRGFGGRAPESGTGPQTRVRENRMSLKRVASRAIGDTILGSDVHP